MLEQDISFKLARLQPAHYTPPVGLAEVDRELRLGRELL